jgi:hypothetical protein
VEVESFLGAGVSFFVVIVIVKCLFEDASWNILCLNVMNSEERERGRERKRECHVCVRGIVIDTIVSIVF